MKSEDSAFEEVMVKRATLRLSKSAQTSVLDRSTSICKGQCSWGTVIDQEIVKDKAGSVGKGQIMQILDFIIRATDIILGGH